MTQPARLRPRDRSRADGAPPAPGRASPERPSSRRPCPPRPSRHVARAAFAGLAALVAGAVATPAAAQDVRPEDMRPFSVTYAVGNNLVTAGDATLELARAGDGWRYSLSTEPSGIFRLTGKGRIEETALIDTAPDGDLLALRPSTYTYRQDDEARRSVDATFDWEAGTLDWLRRGELDSMTLDRPILDRLSVTLAVMSALRRGETEVRVQVFDNGRIKDVIFEDEGGETLETSMGEIETRRVLRSNLDGSTRTTITWFAPSLDYMPVKIEQLKRGELVARLTLKNLRSDVVEIDEPLIEPQQELPVADERR